MKLIQTVLPPHKVADIRSLMVLSIVRICNKKDAAFDTTLSCGSSSLPIPSKIIMLVRSVAKCPSIASSFFLRMSNIPLKMIPMFILAKGTLHTSPKRSSISFRNLALRSSLIFFSYWAKLSIKFPHSYGFLRATYMMILMKFIRSFWLRIVTIPGSMNTRSSRFD